MALVKIAPVLLGLALVTAPACAKPSPCEDTTPRNDDVPASLAPLVDRLPLGDDGAVCGQKDKNGLVVHHHDASPDELMRRYQAWLESEGFVREAEPLFGGGGTYGRGRLKVSLSARSGKHPGILLEGVEVDAALVAGDEADELRERARARVRDHWSTLRGLSPTRSCAERLAALSEAERPRQILWIWDLAPVAGVELPGAPPPFDCHDLQGGAGAGRITRCTREVLDAKLWLVGSHATLAATMEGAHRFRAGAEVGLLSLYDPAARAVVCTVDYAATNSATVEYQAPVDAADDVVLDRAADAVRWDLIQQGSDARRAALAELAPDLAALEL